MSLSGPSLKVLRTFINRANAQYRAAGLGEYQMKVTKRGSVIVPTAQRRGFGAAGADATAGAAAPRAGAAAAAAPASAPGQAASGASATARSGAAPAFSGAKPVGADGFELSWQPVQGAVRYGVWQDGKLMGHVTTPSFAGTVGAGSQSSIQIDAVSASGVRTELTQVLAVVRDKDGPVQLAAAGAAPAAATAPAAPAG